MEILVRKITLCSARKKNAPWQTNAFLEKKKRFGCLIFILFSNWFNYRLHIFKIINEKVRMQVDTFKSQRSDVLIIPMLNNINICTHLSIVWVCQLFLVIQKGTSVVLKTNTLTNTKMELVYFLYTVFFKFESNMSWMVFLYCWDKRSA